MSSALWEHTKQESHYRYCNRNPTPNSYKSRKSRLSLLKGNLHRAGEGALDY